MLVAVLEKENNKYYIYVKNNLNSYYGYSEKNGVIEKLSNNEIDFFKDYIFNLDNIKLEDNYKVSLTKDKKLLAKLSKEENLFNQLLSKKFSVLPILLFQMVLTLAIYSNISQHLNNFNKKLIDIENKFYSGETTLKDVYVGELDSNMIKELINSSPNLNQDEKEYLINENFFEFIDDYIEDQIVYNRIENLDIVDFTEEEKITEEGIAGFYDYTDPKRLHVRDYEDDDTYKTKGTNSHEHIHQYQSNYKYLYIVEATCSLLNSEYYTATHISYKEEQKRLKVLMEIIGTEPILKYVGGDFTEIEDTFDKYLMKKDAENLKNLLKTKPISEGIENVHKEIDELLGKLYNSKFGSDIKDDEVINAIYNDLIYSRNYFNITNSVDMIFEIMPNYSRMQKKYFNFDKEKNIKLENCIFDEMYGNPYYFIFNKLESILLTDKQYQILSLMNPMIDEYITEEYKFLYSYLQKADGTYFIGIPDSKDKNKTTTVNVTLDEAIKLGYVEVKRYYNPKVKSDIRQNYNNFYNKVIYKDDYFLYDYNGTYVICRMKEVPTIKDKFGLNNEKDKKLIK